MVATQCAMPDILDQAVPNFTPASWRSFRLYRPWVQMELDLSPPEDLLAEPGSRHP